MSAPASSEAFFEAVETRRSYYQLSNKSTISDDQLKALVERSVKHAPNSFNMQESRAIVVTGEHHQKLWDVVTETYKKTLGGDADQEAFWKNKIDSAYRPGYGTVLFFEDDAVVKGWQEKMPPLASAFTVWSDNAAGILQYIVWTALAKEGLGASLQHFGQYSAETQEEVQKLFHVPASWRSTGMMPFGVPAGPPGNGAHPKEFLPLEDRVKTFFG